MLIHYYGFWVFLICGVDIKFDKRKPGTADETYNILILHNQKTIIVSEALDENLTKQLIVPLKIKIKSDLVPVIELHGIQEIRATPLHPQSDFKVVKFDRLMCIIQLFML